LFQHNIYPPPILIPHLSSSSILSTMSLRPPSTSPSPSPGPHENGKAHARQSMGPTSRGTPTLAPASPRPGGQSSARPTSELLGTGAMFQTPEGAFCSSFCLTNMLTPFPFLFCNQRRLWISGSRTFRAMRLHWSVYCDGPGCYVLTGPAGGYGCCLIGCKL
jgi:hypothetical protein